MDIHNSRKSVLTKMPIQGVTSSFLLGAHHLQFLKNLGEEALLPAYRRRAASLLLVMNCPSTDRRAVPMVVKEALLRYFKVFLNALDALVADK